MTAVGTSSGRHRGVTSVADSFGSNKTIQPPVPGDIRRGVGHFGHVRGRLFSDPLVICAITRISTKKLPGKPLALKLV
jgi:hypothetical protein